MARMIFVLAFFGPAGALRRRQPWSLLRPRRRRLGLAKPAWSQAVVGNNHEGECGCRFSCLIHRL